MALSASAFSYAWSKWNNDIGEEKVVVQATEWMQTSPPDEVNTPSHVVTKISYQRNFFVLVYMLRHNATINEMYRLFETYFACEETLGSSKFTIQNTRTTKKLKTTKGRLLKES